MGVTPREPLTLSFAFVCLFCPQASRWPVRLGSLASTPRGLTDHQGWDCKHMPPRRCLAWGLRIDCGPSSLHSWRLPPELFPSPLGFLGGWGREGQVNLSPSCKASYFILVPPSLAFVLVLRLSCFSLCDFTCSSPLTS